MELKLTGRTAAGRVTLLDPEDYERFGMCRWSVTIKGKKPYVLGRMPGDHTLYYLHRLVTGARASEDVDHKNGDTLDNRRSNLRLCAEYQNLANGVWPVGRSGLRGVYWCPSTRLWRAVISFKGKRTNLGRYASPEDASAARDYVASQILGEFARLNTPLGEIGRPCLHHAAIRFLAKQVGYPRPQ